MGSPKEKYNTIIQSIEELSKGISTDGMMEYLSEHEISERAFQSAGCLMDDRSKNVLFMFLNGMTVIDYIAQRKMMAAYRHLLGSPSWGGQMKKSRLLLSGHRHLS